MVFYGLAEHPEVHQIDHKGDVGPNKVVPHYNVGGFYAYKDIADAMRRYPDYEGYLFTNDDCFINTSNFKRLDISKIWSTRIIPVKKNTNPVWFWNTWGGWNALSMCYQYLPEKYNLMLYSNITREESCWSGSDLVYIPAQFREDTIFLCDLFAQYGVWLEIAIPHICACLDNKNNFEILHPLWNRTIDLLLKNYKPVYDFAHPVKLSDPRAIEFTKEQLKEKQQEKLACSSKKKRALL
jgi:hypothetical protein